MTSDESGWRRGYSLSGAETRIAAEVRAALALAAATGDRSAICARKDGRDREKGDRDNGHRRSGGDRQNVDRQRQSGITPSPQDRK